MYVHLFETEVLDNHICDVECYQSSVCKIFSSPGEVLSPRGGVGPVGPPPLNKVGPNLSLAGAGPCSVSDGVY